MPASGITGRASLAPSDPSMSTRWHVGRAPKIRKYYRLPKIAPKGNLIVYNHDVVNLTRALRERVYYVQRGGQFVRPPRPTPNLFSARLLRFRALLTKWLPSTTPVSREEFALLYSGRKQVTYMEAVESLKKEGVRPKDAKIKAFVKAEKVKCGSAPRLIQPRDPRYNVEVGRFLKPLEGRVYGAIAKAWRSRRTVMKGMNAHGVAASMREMWEEFRDPVAVEVDAERFDQHVSVDALKWEHAVYESCFLSHSDRKQLRELLRWQLHNKGTGYCREGKVRYNVHGCRMSGDMNTGLGNCLLTSAMFWEYCRVRNVNAKLVNNGDDCVLIMERRDLPRFSAGFQEWFREMGFTMVVEPPKTVFEQIEFCQARPVFDGERWVMVRNTKSFYKDSLSLFPLDNPGATRKWMDAVGQGGSALANGIPIWEEFYRWYMRSADSLPKLRGNRRHQYGILQHTALDTGMMILARGMDRKPGVTEEARFSFYLAYGITPDYQLAIEAEIRLRAPLSFAYNPPDQFVQELWRL